jgi:peroxiredoxin
METNLFHLTSLPDSIVPDIQLGFLDQGEVRSVSASALFAHGVTVILGVPGAFTPVCTHEHIPDFLCQADEFDMLGCRQLVCIAPNDPFVLEEWSKRVDPEHRIRFLSDGNLEFTRALDLSRSITRLFIGERSERYLMVAQNGMIVRLCVEPDILTYSCSSACEALKAAVSLDFVML